MSRTAWVTLATNDGYAIGALVLAHSLRAVGTRHAIHILHTEGVSLAVRFVGHFQQSTCADGHLKTTTRDDIHIGHTRQRARQPR